MRPWIIVLFLSLISISHAVSVWHRGYYLSRLDFSQSQTCKIYSCYNYKFIRKGEAGFPFDVQDYSFKNVPNLTIGFTLDSFGRKVGVDAFIAGDITTKDIEALVRLTDDFLGRRHKSSIIRDCVIMTKTGMITRSSLRAEGVWLNLFCTYSNNGDYTIFAIDDASY